MSDKVYSFPTFSPIPNEIISWDTVEYVYAPYIPLQVSYIVFEKYYYKCY